MESAAKCDAAVFNRKAGPTTVTPTLCRVETM